MARIQFENGITVDFDGTPTPQDVEEVAKRIMGGNQGVQPTPVKKSGFFTNLVNDPFKTLIAKPAVRFGQALAAPIVKTFGNDEQWHRYLDLTQQDTQLPGLMPGSQINIEGVKTGTEGAKQIVGESLKAGSYLTPAGMTLRTAIPLGAAGSALYAGGETLAQGGSAIDAVTSGLEAAPYGAVTAGVLRAAPKIANMVKKGTTSTAEFATAQATGLNPNTIKKIITNPEAVTAAEREGFDRTALANKVRTAIKTRLDQLDEAGQQYLKFRGQSGPYSGIRVPNSMVNTVLGRYGLKAQPVMRAGQVIDMDILKSAESVPLGSGDVRALKDFMMQYGKEGVLSTNGFLNTRQALSKMSEFQPLLEKTDVSDRIAKDLRRAYDDLAGQQLPELKKLDAKYAPERKLLQKVQKDYLNGDGSLKDTAINKIANLGNKGRDKVIERLEKVVPGLREDINIVRALEDIELAKGFKVGSYLRSGMIGVAVGVSGGNVLAAFASALIANPSIAVPILKSFGKAKNLSSPLIDRIVLKMKQGKPLYDAERRVLSAAFGWYIADHNLESKDQTPIADSKQATDEYVRSKGM